MLEVQKYLQTHTLEQLSNEYFIKNHKQDNLVILNYNQIDSPKADPIVMECRGLILELDTWDIISMSFHRFFNYQEQQDITKDFDFENCVVLEKLDGSLINLFYYNDQWKMSTRGRINGDGQVGFSNKTFKQLFDEIVKQYKDFYNNLNIDYDYTFELTSLENKVVKFYDKSDLTLLTVRDKQNNFQELSFKQLQEQSVLLKIKLPIIYNLNDIDLMFDLMKKFNATDEGFVCIDYNKQINGNFQRIKVKNPSYVAIAHIKNSCGSSLRNILQLVMNNEQDEFLSYFPEFKKHVSMCKIKYNKFLSNINKDVDSIKHLLNKPIDKDNNKQYALTVKGMTHTGYMFNLYYGKCKSFDDYIKKCCDIKGIKCFTKQLMKQLKLQDINFENE